MGYTRYWKKKDSKEFGKNTLDKIQEIIKLGEEELKIKIRNGIGEEEPILKPDTIAINGAVEDNEDYESFYLTANDESFNFCKTARKKYDAIINAILMILEDEDYIYDVSSDGFNDEITACYLYSLVNENPVKSFAEALSKKAEPNEESDAELDKFQKKILLNMSKEISKEKDMKKAKKIAENYISYLSSLEENERNILSYFNFKKYEY